MSTDSSSFSPSVRSSFHETYGNRCVLCLVLLPRNGTHCAHLTTREQLMEARRLGLLPVNFQRGSEDNGFLLCPTCHLSYLTTNYLAFSPCLPVLQYINDYFYQTAVADQLPLHEVFHLLRERDVANLPDPSLILDFLDLYVVVPLRSEELHRLAIITAAQPQPFLFDSKDNVFRDGTGDPTNPNLVHIFQPSFVAERDDNPTVGPVLNLLSPNPRLYWQLTDNTEIFLAMVMLRRFNTKDICDEIDLIADIHLDLQHRALYISRRDGRRHVGGAGAGRAGGTHRGQTGAGVGGRLGSGGVDGLQSMPRGPQHKKAPAKKPICLEPLSEEEFEDASDQSLSHPKFYGVHPETWDVASTFTSLVDENLERQSSYFGTSVPSLPEADRNDNPSAWNFAPTFTSDMIIAAARPVMQI